MAKNSIIDLFIDFALNDRKEGLKKSYEAWEKIIRMVKAQGVPFILLIPTPDQ